MRALPTIYIVRTRKDVTTYFFNITHSTWWDDMMKMVMVIASQQLYHDSCACQEISTDFRALFMIIWLLWDLTCISAALLPMCLSNLKAIQQQGVQPRALTKFPDYSLTFPWPFGVFPWPRDKILTFHYRLNTDLACNLTNHTPKLAIAKK